MFLCCIIAVRATDKRIACDEEFSDSEDEGEGGRKNVASHKKGAKRPRVDEDKKEGEEKKTGEWTQELFCCGEKRLLLITTLFSIQWQRQKKKTKQRKAVQRRPTPKGLKLFACSTNGLHTYFS